jgi:hypothetical protein
MMVNDRRRHVSADHPYERKLNQFGRRPATFKARKDLADEFKKKMLCHNPVMFYRLSEGAIAAAGRRRGIEDAAPWVTVRSGAGRLIVVSNSP